MFFKCLLRCFSFFRLCLVVKGALLLLLWLYHHVCIYMSYLFNCEEQACLFIKSHDVVESA